MKFLHFPFRLTAFAALTALAFTGCGAPSGEPITLATLADRLADPLELARLDRPDTRLHSSHDPSGGNDDYGHFLRDSSTPGWKVLVDLKGPGVLSRFWFTGAKESQPHRFRFYFDDEPSPRFEGDIHEWCGSPRSPFPAPLAEYANYCWYSFVPMPYARRLRIECEDGTPEPNGTPRKLYFQISESPLPRGTPVESFTFPLSPRDSAALERLANIWRTREFPPPASPLESMEARLTDPASPPLVLQGPAVLRHLSFTPDWSALPLESRDAFLRDTLVCIRYDGSTNDSVRVPLGDLCGSPWRRTRAASLYFGMTGPSLFTAFPMPFRSRLEIRLLRGRLPPVPVTLTARLDRSSIPDPSLIGTRWGYFHAGWQRTTPRDIGRPHPILNLTASGKFVGCLLSVCALDGSYWVLEGDESIRKDSEKSPAWLGTGLEDYFNGGWYYQNVYAAPTHGLLLKEPFRTVQYRIHNTDPSFFRHSIDMQFERGPEQHNQAFFESVSWLYLSSPLPADSLNLAPDYRRPPRDPRLDGPPILMTTLWNAERFNDTLSARDLLSLALQRNDSTLAPLTPLLQLRLALLDAKITDTPLDFAPFLASPDPATRQAAHILQNERTPPNATALLYASMPARLFLDGHLILETTSPIRAAATSIPLPPGPHTLAIATPRQPYPDWVLLALRTPSAFISTGPTWKFAFDPSGDWASPAFDDSSWPLVGGIGVKGPPEEPQIWVEPDAFIDMQSRALGIRPSLDWPPTATSVIYRKTIHID